MLHPVYFRMAKSLLRRFSREKLFATSSFLPPLPLRPTVQVSPLLAHTLREASERARGISEPDSFHVQSLPVFLGERDGMYVAVSAFLPLLSHVVLQDLPRKFCFISARMEKNRTILLLFSSSPSPVSSHSHDVLILFDVGQKRKRKAKKEGWKKSNYIQ